MLGALCGTFVVITLYRGHRWVHHLCYGVQGRCLMLFYISWIVCVCPQAGGAFFLRGTALRNAGTIVMNWYIGIWLLLYHQLGLGAQSETVGERCIRRIALAFIYIRCGVYYVFYVRPYVHVFSCGNVCGCCLCRFFFRVFHGGRLASRARHRQLGLE